MRDGYEDIDRQSVGEGQPHFFEMFFYDRCETLKREGGAKLSGLDHHIEKVCQACSL